MNEEIYCLPAKGKRKTAINEWENDDSDISWPLRSVYKKIRANLFPQFTCLNKDMSVLLKVRYIWTSL